ncbi:hypothetical protein ACOSP7_021816 [Xanthoceras sorbifolium]
MGTRNQTNAEFRNEVYEILERHESSVYQVYATLQTMLTELQLLRISQNHSQPLPDINPFISTDSNDRNHHLKLNFPKFSDEDPQGWLAKFKCPVTWVEFTKALLLRFGLTDYKDPSEALIRFKQTTTVSTYEEEFEKLSYRVDELPENFLIWCFVIGLNDNIRLDVKIKQPRSLADAIGVA